MRVTQTNIWMEMILLTPMEDLVYLVKPYGATVRTKRKTTGKQFLVPTFELSKKGTWTGDHRVALNAYQREIVAGLAQKLAAAGCVKVSIFWKMRPAMIESWKPTDPHGSLLFCEVGAAGWKTVVKPEDQQHRVPMFTNHVPKGMCQC